MFKCQKSRKWEVQLSPSVKGSINWTEKSLIRTHKSEQDSRIATKTHTAVEYMGKKPTLYKALQDYAHSCVNLIAALLITISYRNTSLTLWAVHFFEKKNYFRAKKSLH